MSKFKLDDYETVDSRIKKFYADHENGRIITELEKISDDYTTVVVKAYLYIDDIMVSSGYAMEIKGQGGFANKEAWLENCETSAIGRSLANYGYSGDLRQSREEIEKLSDNAVDIFNDIKNKIELSETIKELESVWKEITKNNQILDQKQVNALIGFGKKRKQELTSHV